MPTIWTLISSRYVGRLWGCFSEEDAITGCNTCLPPLGKTARTWCACFSTKSPSTTPELMGTISRLLFLQRRSAPAVATLGKGHQLPSSFGRNAPALPLAALPAGLLLLALHFLLLASGSTVTTLGVCIILVVVVVVLVLLLLLGLSRLSPHGFFLRLSRVLRSSQQHRARNEGLRAHGEVLFGGVETQDRAEGLQ